MRWDLSSGLRTVAALMAERRGGTTAAATVATLVLRPVKEETEKMKMRAWNGAGERWRVKGSLWSDWPHGAGRRQRTAIAASTRRPYPGVSRPLMTERVGHQNPGTEPDDVNS